MDTGSDEVVLPRHVQTAVRRPGGDDHRMRRELLARRQRRHEVVPVDRDRRHRHRRQQLDAVAAGLGHEPVRQLGAGDALGEPGIVVDAVADARLAAERAASTTMASIPSRAA